MLAAKTCMRSINILERKSCQKRKVEKKKNLELRCRKSVLTCTGSEYGGFSSKTFGLAILSKKAATEGQVDNSKIFV